MNFYTVRDLRTHPREVWEKLSEAHEVIITNNGKPSAFEHRGDGSFVLTRLAHLLEHRGTVPLC